MSPKARRLSIPTLCNPWVSKIHLLSPIWRPFPSWKGQTLGLFYNPDPTQGSQEPNLTNDHKRGHIDLRERVLHVWHIILMQKTLERGRDSACRAGHCDIKHYVVLGWRICNLEALIWSCTTVVANMSLYTHTHNANFVAHGSASPKTVFSPG